ncbi:MAG: TPM domain-containing protein [Muribaculaceae bacterium]|nr:TPM domain-containing protein [Muribaculaceae bacterium]
MNLRTLAVTLVTAVACLAAAAGVYTPASVPDVHRADRRDYVANPDGILSAQAVGAINTALDTLRRSLTVEPMVVAVDNIEDPDDASQFATDLFELWGLGKADRDNGLLILIVKDQRKVTIRPGYGLEGVLPDITCGRIIREVMAPAFRDGDYDAGTVRAVATVASLLSDPVAAEEYRSTAADADFAGDEDDLSPFGIFLVVASMVAVVMLLIFLLEYAAVRNRDDYDKYRTLVKLKHIYLALTLFGLFIPAIATIPLLLCLNHWRNHARNCPNCSARMKKVDEVHDNDYLTPSQDLEERIGSVDYDVWLCPQCGETDILPYASQSSPYVECDNCHARTARLVRDRIVVRPTTRSQGRGVREYECLNCHHRNDRYYDIPKEPDPMAAVAAGAVIGAAASRRGGGYGGGFGGGSFGGGFGGGHTGGGGATGGW